ncbi:hypothetical protein CR513_21396, partial [Mucuna pruriens]
MGRSSFSLHKATPTSVIVITIEETTQPTTLISANRTTDFSTLSSNAEIDYGRTLTKKVYAIGLCLQHCSADVLEVCPKRKEAIGWYEDAKCILRYSDRSILGLRILCQIHSMQRKWSSSIA